MRSSYNAKLPVNCQVMSLLVIAIKDSLRAKELLVNVMLDYENLRSLCTRMNRADLETRERVDYFCICRLIASLRAGRLVSGGGLP